MDFDTGSGVEETVTVRPANRKDISTLWEIEQRCFSDPYPRFLLESLLTLHPETFLVAEDKTKKVVGYIVAAVRWQTLGHILSVAVDPQQQRKGIGSHLLQELIAELESVGVKEVTLEVRETSKSAQSLYGKFSFKPLYIVKEYYPDGENAIVMHLSTQRQTMGA